MEKLNAIAYRCFDVARYLAGRFSADRGSQIAAALTYMSLFALVPLLTISFSMASAIPSFTGVEDKLQNLVFHHLVPDTGAEIQGYLDEFSRQAKNLTGVGILFLVVTSVLMLRNIEQAFNIIWRTRENRGPVASFLLYWAVLSLSPIFIGLALGIGTYLTSLPILVDNLDAVGLTSARLLSVIPILLSWAAFTLVYAAVPNCYVPPKHAMIGGLIAAVAFNGARYLFTKVMVNSSYTLIYGAFAAVPLFLLWIYLSWTIVLIGGILVHSMSAYRSEAQASVPPVLKALNMLYVLWERQRHGGVVREMELMRGEYALDSDSFSELRSLLLEHRVITQNEQGRYLLSRDLDTVTFWQLKEWINDERPLVKKQREPSTWRQHAYDLLSTQKLQQRDTLGLSIADLFRFTPAAQQQDCAKRQKAAQ
ncbi:MAG: transposase [Gammaproteobacteria bacterium]|nr:MAG: transposase [Gammaproteobacteria bacterium]